MRGKKITAVTIEVDESDKDCIADARHELRRRLINGMVDRAQVHLKYADDPPVDLATVEHEKIEWLVEHYLPRTLTLLVGEEGAGKGLMGVWFALQQLKAGRNVLFLSTEDTASEVKGRLVAAAWKPKSGQMHHLSEPRAMEYLRQYIVEQKINLDRLLGGRPARRRRRPDDTSRRHVVAPILRLEASMMDRKRACGSYYVPGRVRITMRNQFFMPGELPLVLLALLADRTQGGYELLGELERWFAPSYRPSPGSVYPALSALRAEGLVEQVPGQGKATYEVTDDGHRLLTDQRDALRRIESRTSTVLASEGSLQATLAVLHLTC